MPLSIIVCKLPYKCHYSLLILNCNTFFEKNLIKFIKYSETLDFIGFLEQKIFSNFPLNSDLSALSEDIKLLATLDGASSINTWIQVSTADNVRIDSFRSFVVSLVRSDGTVMRNELIPSAQMLIARYNENTITCSMSAVNGLTSGSLYGMCGIHSATAFALWINHANYSLKVYGCK